MQHSFVHTAPPFRRIRRPVTIALAALLAAAIGMTIAFPLIGAIPCPRCFGFERLDGQMRDSQVFVETTMPAEERREVRDIIAQAGDAVRRFYGSLLRRPRVFVCATDACYRRLGGGRSRGMALFDRALVLAPEGLTAVIAAHELAHIELHARAGAWRAWRGAIPRWFDEGLAVNVSDDPRYLAPGRGTARCRARTDDPLPASRRDWLAAADDALYALSACRVSEWLAGHGGAAGVTRLAARIADGETFEQAAR